MTPALGRTLILLALLFSTAGALLGFAIGRRPPAESWAWPRRLAYGFAASMIAANLLMVLRPADPRLHISYVAQVGSRLVPDLGRGRQPVVLARGLDPVLGPGARRLHGRAPGHQPRAARPEYMPYAIGGLARLCGAFFSFLIAGPAQPFKTVSPSRPTARGPTRSCRTTC